MGSSHTRDASISGTELVTLPTGSHNSKVSVNRDKDRPKKKRHYSRDQINVGILPQKKRVTQRGIHFCFKKQKVAFYEAFDKAGIIGSDESLRKVSDAAWKGALTVSYQQPRAEDFFPPFPRTTTYERKQDFERFKLGYLLEGYYPTAKELTDIYNDRKADKDHVYLVWDRATKVIRVVTWESLRKPRQPTVLQYRLWLLAYPTILRNCAEYELAGQTITEAQVKDKEQWQTMRKAGEDALIQWGSRDLLGTLTGDWVSQDLWGTA